MAELFAIAGFAFFIFMAWMWLGGWLLLRGSKQPSKR